MKTAQPKPLGPAKWSRITGHNWIFIHSSWEVIWQPALQYHQFAGDTHLYIITWVVGGYYHSWSYRRGWSAAHERQWCYLFIAILYQYLFSGWASTKLWFGVPLETGLSVPAQAPARDWGYRDLCTTGAQIMPLSGAGGPVYSDSYLHYHPYRLLKCTQS